MKKAVLFLMFFAVLFTSCKTDSYTPEGLKKMSQEEVFDMFVKKEFLNSEEAVYKDNEGKVLSLDSLMALPGFQENYIFDLYVDEDRKIKELVLREATKEDKEFRKKLQEAVQAQSEF